MKIVVHLERSGDVVLESFVPSSPHVRNSRLVGTIQIFDSRVDLDLDSAVELWSALGAMVESASVGLGKSGRSRGGG